MFKRLDIYLVKNFLGLFIATFFICIFILLMQFVWMHVTDLVGKGAEIGLLAEFFVYAVASVVPLALPLAILLSSLISFGNLGEKFELTAMKAAGISLFRIMRPLTITIAMLSVGAFFFSNNVLPESQKKLWALVFSLRQKSPELEIPVGEFYARIPGVNLYVKHKNPDTGLLEQVMIYDVSNGFDNASVTKADSARLLFSDDQKYIFLRLYNGEAFENLSYQQREATGVSASVPYRRETFRTKQLLIDFDSEFTRIDESVLADQHVSKNLSQLLASIDSIQSVAYQQSHEQSTQLIETHYLGRDNHTHVSLPTADAEAEVERRYDVDSLYASLTLTDRQRALRTAYDRAQSYSDQVMYNSLILDDAQRTIRKHEIEMHRKFTLAFACLIFFFIGAPLGAIIRKGGLGAPVVISVVMFIIYYIIDNTGYKMAREALWPCWQGMWLSSMILLPIGIFLTYKAATDSALLNPEAWLKLLHNIATPFRNITSKLNRTSYMTKS